MRYVVAAVVGACLLGGVATPSTAGTLTVEFDLTSSSILALGGFSIPPFGTVTSGHARLKVPAASIGSPSAGSATLDQFTLVASINVPFTGAAVTGALSIAQLNRALGTLSGGFGQVGLGGGFVRADQAVDCAGPSCSFVGTFPLISGATAPSFSNVGVNGLTNPGAGGLDGMLHILLSGGHTVDVSLLGTEVSRSFEPDPSLPALGSAGVLILVALITGAPFVAQRRSARARHRAQREAP